MGLGMWRVRDQLARIGNTVDVFRTNGPAVRAQCGKRLPRQIVEWLRLWAGNGKLEPDEYYAYGLYDDAQFNWSEKQTFLGRQREHDFAYLMNLEPWSAVVNDKLVTQTLLAQCQLAVPELYGLYHPDRKWGNLPNPQSAAELASFLRDSVQYPFVCKPVWGISGQDVNVVMALDTEADLLTLGDGTQVRVEDFAGARRSLSRDGHIFQELLRPSPEVARVCGPRICSIRAIVLVRDDGPQIYQTYWKIATGNNMTDNFHKGKAGNIVGTVDVQSGRVVNVIQGRGRHRTEVDHHPDTGELLNGLVLPDWQQAMELCLAAAVTIPRVRIQAWDIALCDRGPVLLEVNLIGGMDLPQVAMNRGLYDGHYKEVLMSCGRH